MDVCACPPPGLVLVHPPDTVLLTSQASRPSSGGLPRGKGSARRTEAAFSCSLGRGRLRLKQHHVSRGSAVSEGKGPWVPQPPGDCEWTHVVGSDQLEGVRVVRKELDWQEQQKLSLVRGPDGGPSGAFSGGTPNFLSGAQGLRTLPESLVLSRVLPVPQCWVPWVSLLREARVEVGGKEAISLGAPEARP